MLKNLILDLDGTLLFGEYCPGALVIKGRRRDSYLARETLNILIVLQNHYHIYLATGRSLQSTNSILNTLLEEGVRFSGAVAENGGVWVDSKGSINYLTCEAWMKTTNKALSVAEGIAQKEFITCLALLSPQPELTLRVLGVYSEANLEFHLLKDGNKLFVLAKNILKKSALDFGLGAEKLITSAGAGNDLNDSEWLKSVSLPVCTSCSKDEIKKIVEVKNGLISREQSHEGIQELLRFFMRMK